MHIQTIRLKHTLQYIGTPEARPLPLSHISSTSLSPMAGAAGYPHTEHMAFRFLKGSADDSNRNQLQQIVQVSELKDSHFLKLMGSINRIPSF
jgi:hypothetical protein